jgi:uncharacterized membrane protein YccC
MTPSILGKSCLAAVRALGRELAAWRSTRERALFGAQAVLSVGLAVLFAYQLGLSHAWWAAISGFAVMRDSFAGCAERGMQRVLGSVAGAMLGMLSAPWVSDDSWRFVPLIGAVGGYVVFRANGSKASYAWVLGGVTALMVAYEAQGVQSLAAIFHFAYLRVGEVIVGTLASVLVSGSFHGLSGLTRGNAATSDQGEGALAAAADPNATRAVLLILAIEAGLTVSIVATLTHVIHLPGFAQAMVTAIALLILPASALTERSASAVLDRMVQRLLGCLLAGLAGVILLPLTNGAALPCLLVLSLGVWIGCHVQTGVEGASYVGRQFAVAFIMVFVQDQHWSADPKPALMRFCGIVTGVAVLACVMLVVRAGIRVWGASSRG